MKKRHILWAMGIAVLLAAGCGKEKNTEWKVTQYAEYGFRLPSAFDNRPLNFD